MKLGNRIPGFPEGENHSEPAGMVDHGIRKKPPRTWKEAPPYDSKARSRFRLVILKSKMGLG